MYTNRPELGVRIIQRNDTGLKEDNMKKGLLWLISMMLLMLVLIFGCTANVSLGPPSGDNGAGPSKWGTATWGQSKWNT